jgi:REP element-mobilizing transposase RayT
LLKPTALTSNIFLYCLAVAAQKTGVLIHAVCTLSNHYHAIVSDPDTNIAEFYGWLHKYVSKSVNASLGRFENLWSSEKTSVIALQECSDVLDKILYTLCNPVQAHLVAHGDLWPGVWLFKRSHSRSIERPDVYFREDGDMPERVELTIKPPPQFGDLSIEEYEQRVTSELEEKEREIRQEMDSKGQSFMGVQGVMYQQHLSTPLSPEKRFGTNPRIAANNKWLRIEAIQRHKEFLFTYRQAFRLWKEGNREVVFPAGTYALRIHAGVKCHSG